MATLLVLLTAALCGAAAAFNASALGRIITAPGAKHRSAERACTNRRPIRDVVEAQGATHTFLR